MRTIPSKILGIAPLSALIIFIFLYSCARMMAPKAHVWDQIKWGEIEDPGYALYTYVLFGRNLQVSSTVGGDDEKRYCSLLNAIVTSTLSVELKTEQKTELNLFLIPSLSENPADSASLTKYNFGMSMHYLHSLAKILGNKERLGERLKSRPGPFLISTTLELGLAAHRMKLLGLKPKDITRAVELPLLYVDLSTTNPAAMTEVVKSYKKKIEQVQPHGIERFSSVRLSLLDAVLDANDNVVLLLAELPKFSLFE